MQPLDTLIKLVDTNKAILDIVMRVMGNLAIEPSELSEIGKLVVAAHEGIADIHKFFDGVKGNESLAEVAADAEYVARLGAHILNPSHNAEPPPLQLDTQASASV